MTGWPRRKLSAVLRIQNGFAFDSKQFTTDGGTPLIRIRDLKNGLSTETNFDGLFDPRYIVRAGDFLIGMDGEFGCYEWRGPDALLNQRVCKLTDFAAGIEPRFLFYGINSYLKDIEDVTTFTTVKHLSSKQIADIEFPLPPLEEQRRIVAMLDEAFAAIDTATANAEKNLANARELFQQAIKNALSGETANWKVAPFEECLDPIKYPAKVQRKAFLAEGDYPIVSQEAAFINGFWNNPQDLLRVPRPLVVFGDHTQVLKYVDFDFALGADGVKLLLPKPPITGKFLYYFLKANPLPSAGYARHYRHLKSLTVRYPPVAEQHAITDGLDEIGAAVEDLEDVYRSKIETLSELKQSLLHRAFFGELTEREPIAA